MSAPQAARRRKFWGWGYEGEGPGPEQRARIAELLRARFAVELPEPLEPPRIEQIALSPPRIAPPAALAGFCSTATADRAAHAYGKSFRDVVRALRRDYGNPPDVVAFPADEGEVAQILDWCDRIGASAIPYGGGSSVVGGVEPPSETGGGSVSIDLGRLDRVLEVDRVSRAARIQAGVLGPALEDQLRPHGLTLRHFPQSFELSTLGGWIATRSGGHFAMLYTHIDEFVEALRVVTPSGTIATRRLPGSGAGPSPERLFIGSEGTLGVITEAWMRLQDRPTLRASASVRFADFMAAAGAVRAISQSGLNPSNCRLLDPGEALTAGAGAGDEAVLVLGFESADHPLDAWMSRALECCRDHGGQVPDGAGRTRDDEAGAREGAVGAWRKAFLDGPYLRDALVMLGMLSETFETAVTWDRFPEFHRGVLAATEEAVRRVCGAGTVTCRFTHVYPDGPAPYYTIVAPARRGAELEQWAEVKSAASEALLRLGGTITHHHAVGRDHRPWYDRERPDGFARALLAAKAALDPRGILNPGVLIDPLRP
ncbi:MAG TPA: FAD-linked oxidase C-terminal domain-containing protein [Candidatus Bathyarchaeia archaeon]|nr:FAD-linked oxidase C-terminal domain-containing protein [Candidatus Bathyarchaeia archaeon]